LAGDVGRDHLDLGEEREELRVRLADLLRQLGAVEVGPRDVGRGVPLPRHRLLVVAFDVVRPDVALAVDVGLEVREGPSGIAAPRGAKLRFPRISSASR
jgi:hypothetical protein